MSEWPTILPRVIACRSLPGKRLLDAVNHRVEQLVAQAGHGAKIQIGGSRSGQEVEHPMAVVILGGLVMSTVLNLLVLPAALTLFGRFERPRADPLRAAGV